eukprot:6200322-Pleurochrysis_carterae.AAC.1
MCTWLMRRSAIGPCPCPSEIATSFFEKRISFANFKSESYGSAPADSTNTMGSRLLASRKEVARLNGGASM